MRCNRGRELFEQYNRREELLAIKDNILNMLARSSDNSPRTFSYTEGIFGRQFWEELKEETNEYRTDATYMHRGVCMRSRGEVIIAQILDSLGMEYKYEPGIKIGSELYCPDFAVYLPEFERCFFIEFLGMLDNKDYALKNGLKIGNYLNSGMVINKDIILFCGTKNSMGSIEEMVQDIIALIQKYCYLYSSVDESGD